MIKLSTSLHVYDVKKFKTIDGQVQNDTTVEEAEELTSLLDSSEIDPH